MKFLVGGLALLALLCSAHCLENLWLDLETRDHHVNAVRAAKTNPRGAFMNWLHQFEKAYREDLEEVERRFAVWLENLEYVVQHNEKEGSSYWLGMNPLADLTNEEYKAHYLGYRSDLRQLGTVKTGFMYENATAVKEIDWRAKGAVTEVKNQKQCGSCWAFSTTGSVEGINAIYSGKLVTLSEQELIDCDTSRDHGCHGGLMDFAFAFIMANGGLDTEEDYKYKAAEDQCHIEKENRHVVSIDGYEDVPPNDEGALLKAVSHQPVSVAIEADERDFQLYQGGVFDAPCGVALDHGVLAVGFGNEAGQDYWIVKNSWGPEWGDKGYIKLVRGLSATPMGQCGIAMQASYPTKTSPNPPPTPPSPPEPPAPPSPEPTQCDEATTCPNGSTCCCMREFFGFCFTWACCPLPSATCCDDHEHCCPSDLPVCDTTAGRCLASKGTIEGSVPWATKTPAERTHDGRPWHWPWSNKVAAALS